jgi:AraC-like DNA-binding protein
MPKHPPKREGFPDQHLVVLPESVVSRMRRQPLLRGLFPTASGYFPEALGHLVERTEGVPEMILIACLSGRGWVRTEGSGHVRVKLDEVVIIPGGTPHAYGADDEAPWSIMWAHCRGGDIGDFQKLLGATRGVTLLHLPVGTCASLDFSTIYENLESGHTLANLLASSTKLRFVFSEINRLRVPAHPKARTTEDRLRESVAWMQRHLDRRAALAEIAGMAGLSVPHYSALFSRRTGIAPIDYFLRLKIQRACQLLDTTNLRIGEVANAVGMDDPFYFSRLFKRIIGQSPRSYRKIQKG